MKKNTILTEKYKKTIIRAFFCRSPHWTTLSPPTKRRRILTRSPCHLAYRYKLGEFHHICLAKKLAGCQYNRPLETICPTLRSVYVETLLRQKCSSLCFCDKNDLFNCFPGISRYKALSPGGCCTLIQLHPWKNKLFPHH